MKKERIHTHTNENDKRIDNTAIFLRLTKLY
jgi:hypothetical protein